MKKSTIFEIKDSGIGISDKHKNKVFDRFYRGDASRSSEGSGLGLSLVAAIAKLHNGKIELVNTQNNGLSFRIIF